MWTRFMDMHSGGSTKEEPYQYIFIEAPEEEAKIIFFNRFGHNPERVTCTCCGDDYSISDAPTLEEATGFDRGCHYDKKEERYVERSSEDRFSLNKYQALDEYLKRDDILIVRQSEIKPEQRKGEVPRQGYVWVD